MYAVKAVVFQMIIIVRLWIQVILKRFYVASSKPVSRQTVCRSSWKRCYIRVVVITHFTTLIGLCVNVERNYKYVARVGNDVPCSIDVKQSSWQTVFFVCDWTGFLVSVSRQKLSNLVSHVMTAINDKIYTQINMELIN